MKLSSEEKSLPLNVTIALLSRRRFFKAGNVSLTNLGRRGQSEILRLASLGRLLKM
jgi:hypothetical protein